MIEIMAGACVVKDNKLLVLQESAGRPQAGKWAPPGGHGLPNEDPMITAKREVKEETNLDIEITGLVQATLSKTPSGKEYLVLFYYALALNPRDIKINDESSKFLWLGLADIDILDYREPFVKPLLIKSLNEPASPVDVIKVENFKEEH